MESFLWLWKNTLVRIQNLPKVVGPVLFLSGAYPYKIPISNKAVPFSLKPTHSPDRFLYTPLLSVPGCTLSPLSTPLSDKHRLNSSDRYRRSNCSAQCPRISRRDQNPAPFSDDFRNPVYPARHDRHTRAQCIQKCGPQRLDREKETRKGQKRQST